ncbi:MAG: nuclear transport factor 2 family protein [Dehalococcoidia bacterium]
MNDDTAEKEILAAEEVRCRATREGDLETLKRLLREDYLHVTGSGSMMNRDQYIEWVREMPRRHERRDLRVRRYSDTAVIMGPLTNHLSQPDGSTRVVEAFVTQVAHREDGLWRFVAFQITPRR